MPRGAFEDEGVFVLDFALNAAVAEGCVFLGGRNGKALGGRGAKKAGVHAEGRQDFAPHPGREVFAGEDLESLAEENEAGVGVFGAGSGLGFDGQGEARAIEGGGSGGCAEEFDVTGKAGVVREQVAQGDLASVFLGRSADDEAGEQFAEGCVEVELATLIEEHGCGGCGDDLGEAGNVEDGVGLNEGRVGVVGKAAESALEDNLVLNENAEGTARESVGKNGFVEDAQGRLKAAVERSRGREGRDGRWVHGFSASYREFLRGAVRSRARRKVKLARGWPETVPESYP